MCVRAKQRNASSGVQTIGSPRTGSTTRPAFDPVAALRDKIKALQSILERQKVVFPADYKDSDVLAMARADNEACVQIFFIRGGKLIGRDYFLLERDRDD